MAASSDRAPPLEEAAPATGPPNDEVAEPDVPKRTPTFGGLKENAQSRSQRSNIQFFDSADWVLKNKGQSPVLQSPTSEVIAAFTQIESGDAPVVRDSE
jgi:hypothetical protein